MLRSPIHCLLLIGPIVLGPGPAAASPQPRAVLEFFVSQGCSASPPANRITAELAADPGLIILTMPVSYWDYRGWKDTLARPFTAKRQKAYGAALDRRAVFTPQAIVNGIETATGSERPSLDRALRRASAAQTVLPVDLDVAQVKDTLTVDVHEGAGTGEVVLLAVTGSVSVDIRGGDNAGLRETYTNVVRDLRPLGIWVGTPTRFSVRLDDLRAQEADSFVVLVQGTDGGHPGKIIGAAQTRREKP